MAASDQPQAIRITVNPLGTSRETALHIEHAMSLCNLCLQVLREKSPQTLGGNSSPVGHARSLEQSLDSPQIDRPCSVNPGFCRPLYRLAQIRGSLQDHLQPREQRARTFARD